MDTHAANDRDACRATVHDRNVRAGAGLELGWLAADTALGPMVAAASGDGLCLVEFLENEFLDTHVTADIQREAEARVRGRFPRARLRVADGEIRVLLQSALGRIELPDGGEPLPLDFIGTAFQCRVWMLLRDLGWGERVSYSELAQRLGRPGSSRAVARACGDNPLAVLVPCHRVVGADGALRGYRWGLARKQRLLEREAKGDGEREEPRKAGG